MMIKWRKGVKTKPLQMVSELRAITLVVGQATLIKQLCRLGSRVL